MFVIPKHRQLELYVEFEKWKGGSSLVQLITKRFSDKEKCQFIKDLCYDDSFDGYQGFFTDFHDKIVKENEIYKREQKLKRILNESKIL